MFLTSCPRLGATEAVSPHAFLLCGRSIFPGFPGSRELASESNLSETCPVVHHCTIPCVTWRRVGSDVNDKGVPLSGAADSFTLVCEG